MNAATLQPATFISSLLQPDIYDPPVEQCTLIENAYLLGHTGRRLCL